MEKNKMTHFQFGKLFKTKPRKGGFDCYGTWNCDDVSYWADTEDNARIAAYEGLVRMGYLMTDAENTHRNKVLANYASLAKTRLTP